MDGNTARQLTPSKKSPRLVETVWCSSINSSLQISIFRIHQIFNISFFPQFNLSFKKKHLFHKMLKNHPKIYTKPQNIGECSRWRDLALLELEHERDIGTKATLNDVKTPSGKIPP